MDDEEQIAWAIGEADRLRKYGNSSVGPMAPGVVAAACDFLRIYGRGTSFYAAAQQTLENAQSWVDVVSAADSLAGWVEFKRLGLIDEAPFEVRARREAAGDLMDQVATLLDLDDVVPAAAVMLAGAALEEALRGIFEAAPDLEISARSRPSIDAYASALRSADLITKSQKRDIDSCAGLRNSAAHGDFGSVGIANAELMAQQVNLLLSQLAAS